MIEDLWLLTLIKLITSDYALKSMTKVRSVKFQYKPQVGAVDVEQTQRCMSRRLQQRLVALVDGFAQKRGVSHDIILTTPIRFIFLGILYGVKVKLSAQIQGDTSCVLVCRLRVSSIVLSRKYHAR